MESQKHKGDVIRAIVCKKVVWEDPDVQHKDEKANQMQSMGELEQQNGMRINDHHWKGCTYPSGDLECPH